MGNNDTASMFNSTPSLSITVILSLLYGVISLMSVLGNALVIFVVLRNKKMRTITNSFLVNLAISDIIQGLFATPFQFAPAILYRWPFGDFMCPFVPFIKTLSILVSIGTLTVISVDRYFAVCHPLRRRLTPCSTAVTVGIIWINGICTSTPKLLNLKTIEHILPDGGVRMFCVPQWSSDQCRNIYHLYIFVTSYAVPLVVITVAYSLIAKKMYVTKTPGESNDARDQNIAKNKKKVITMGIGLVIVFAFCWLPLQLYDFLKFVTPDILSYKHINIIWFCCNWLAMSNAACNPFIYGLLNDNFKREYRKVFELNKMTVRVGPVPMEPVPRVIGDQPKQQSWDLQEQSPPTLSQHVTRH
ncbi:neuropeptide receptor-like protein 3 [Saccoglossus kowalevskii]|uniref:Neuropeptide receptor-like protein 3 n=1 Tax=Saccoglossus kowalevskii TaxID=10224 RepID=D1LX83_SACKO|nr:neuropeptide receptor-like protein 3 [Saccoglossus kowalevskii]ACY92589.1 neuropeptide receptor-like protein 3 [Saccoglossus kowalevskii]